MTNKTTEEKPNNSAEGDPLLQELAESVERINRTSQVNDPLHVTVKRRGKWFEITGWVKNHRAKIRLISQVPMIRGKQWIIDKMKIRPS